MWRPVFWLLTLKGQTKWHPVVKGHVEAIYWGLELLPLAFKMAFGSHQNKIKRQFCSHDWCTSRKTLVCFLLVRAIPRVPLPLPASSRMHCPKCTSRTACPKGRQFSLVLVSRFCSHRGSMPMQGPRVFSFSPLRLFWTVSDVNSTFSLSLCCVCVRICVYLQNVCVGRARVCRIYVQCMHLSLSFSVCGCAVFVK